MPNTRVSISRGLIGDQGKAVTLQKTQPPQLTLWQTFFPSDPATRIKDAYSNTAELYDAVPKYFSSKKRMAEQRGTGSFCPRSSMTSGTKTSATL